MSIIKLNYTNSSSPVKLNQTTSDFISAGSNTGLCPITTCSLKTSPDCKTDYTKSDISLKGSNIYTLSNFTTGFTKKRVCLVCKNKD